MHVTLFCPVYQGYILDFNSSFLLLNGWSSHFPFKKLIILRFFDRQKHSLFRQIFVIYKDASKVVKQVWLIYLGVWCRSWQNSCYFCCELSLIYYMLQAVERHIPILVRTMGPSSELLEIISDPPSASENLLMQVLIIK